MDDGGAVADRRLLLDDVEELEGAADRCVWVRPLGALNVSDL